MPTGRCTCVKLDVGSLHLSKSYSLPDVARMAVKSGVYRGLVGKPEGKIPLGRPRRR
jgi:hypothetical protein